MAMHDTGSRHARRLRSAVADLARRSTDDIEAIWHALSEVEREQLRPLLADASSVLSTAPENMASVLRAPVPDDESEIIASHLARVAGHWPDELVALAIRQTDETTRAKCLDALPDELRATLSRIPDRTVLTPRARDALLSAVRRDASALPVTGTTRDATRPMPKTWRLRLRRMLRRGRDT